MTVHQLSVFVENKSGKLALLTKILAKNNIDIRALSVADTTDYGIVRLIVDQPIKAHDILKKEDYTVKLTDVIVVELEDKVGSLANMLSLLDSVGISVEYMYAFIARKFNKAFIIIRVEDDKKAAQILQENDFHIANAEEIDSI